MQVYRYMSEAEANRLQAGEKLENRTEHQKLRGEASTAFGFCFGIGDKAAALEAYRHLNGITSFEYLLVAALKPDVKLYKCKGRYPNYSKWDGSHVEEPQHVYIDELCTSQYSVESFESYELVHWPIKMRLAALAFIDNKEVQQLYKNFMPEQAYQEMQRYALYELSLLKK